MPGLIRASVTPMLLFCSFLVSAHAIAGAQPQLAEEKRDTAGEKGKGKIPPKKTEPPHKSLLPAKSPASESQRAAKTSVKPGDHLKKIASGHGLGQAQTPVHTPDKTGGFQIIKPSNKTATGDVKETSHEEIEHEKHAKTGCEQAYSNPSAQKACEQRQSLHIDKKN